MLWLRFDLKGAIVLGARERGWLVVSRTSIKWTV